MQVGFGTERLRDRAGVELCRYAHEVGYRTFDTALAYGNQQLVGEALSTVPRDSFTLISKIARPHLAVASVRACAERILHDLGTDPIDVLLIHAPRGVDTERVAVELLVLVELGLIRSWGLSNYTARHLHQLEERGLRPDILQVEIHPYLTEKPLTDYCAVRGIEVMAHTAFAHGRIWSDATLARLAARVGASAGQLVLAWHRERGVVPIISSSDAAHVRANTVPVHGSLSAEVIAAIDALDCGARICNDPEWAEF